MLKIVKIVVILLVCALLLTSCSLQTSRRADIPSELPKEFQTLGEVWSVLNQNYVEQNKLNPTELAQGAINGMLGALADPYTSYLDPETFKHEYSDFQGKFEGIGATVGIKDGNLVIIAPMPDSPAEKAGLLAGDKILEINGESTSGLSVDQAVIKIRGDSGTSVKLKIQHEGADAPIEVDIVRAEIKMVSVSTKVLEDNIGYISISSFTERTAQELDQELPKLLDKGVTSLVLDLRNNPGGLLQTVTDVAGQFLDGGTVLYEVNRQGERKEWKAEHGGLATKLPLVVLVNYHSASGSEVLAGALQDRGRAPLVGTTTFGKGSVNRLYPLSDGSALYLTVERWLTPSGRPIEGKGLEPDYRVERTTDDVAQRRDPQLDRAVEYLKTEFKTNTTTIEQDALS